MQIGIWRQPRMGDLASGREMERSLPGVKKRRTLVWGRHMLQQRAEGMPMHHADTVMALRPERQCVHIAAPAQCVATAHIVFVAHAPW